MVTKMLKIGVFVVAGSALVGGLVFGKDVVSYMKCSARSVQTAVKDTVPIEFELKRARDLLEDIIPEMHAHIKLIAQEEVEIAALKADIQKSKASIEEEAQRIHALRSALEVQKADYTFGRQHFSRADVKVDLAARFERYKEAEVVLASKKRLLTTREQSLNAAMQLLDKTKSQKHLLQDKIGALEGQYRIVKASAVGSRFDIDNSKLAQTEKLIGQIKKRLDVAERVLAHESRFVQTIPVDVIPEKDLLAQIDEHFNPAQDGDAVAKADSDSVLKTVVTAEAR